MTASTEAVMLCGDLRNLPDALTPLTSLPHWVVWRWETVKGKRTKVPYRPDKPERKAKNNDPATWSTYAIALSAHEARKADGIGFCLLNSGLAAFDIDNCRDPATGAIDPWAQQFVVQVNSYTEITVSGTGLRIIGRGTGPKMHRKQPASGKVSLETYRRAERYIVMTGNPLPGAPLQLADINSHVDAIVAELDEKKSKANGAAKPSGDQPPLMASANGAKPAGIGDIDIDTLPISRDEESNSRRDDPEHPYPSRSEAVMAVLIAMAGAGCTDQQMAAVMRGPIGDHVRDQGDPDKYLARQIATARNAATDPDVAKLNDSYALVIVGDKIAVMKTSTTEGIKFLTLSAFEHWHGNCFVGRGEGKSVPLAKLWLQHPQRRQYEGLVFAPGRDVPGHYNLWRGFAVEPKPGSCARLLAHLRDNVCRGDAELYAWVMGWFAQIFQRPGQKMGTSLVLRGKQGTGKTKVGQVIGWLLGHHYALVSDPRYVTGRFNSHLVSCLLLHCDESFWAGDHAAEGKLKDLITGEHHFIEYKGKEPVRVQNFVRLFVTGNPDWLIPAAFKERRFAVLDIGEDHMQDLAYFAAIDEEMENGGRVALLDHLLSFDLSTVDLRTIPKTAALLDQQISSLTPEQGWWLDVLNRGELPWGCDEFACCPTRSLIDQYIEHASRRGVRRRAIETQIGMFMGKHVPGLIRRREMCRIVTRTGMVMEAVMVYAFPPLAECRDAFAKLMQQDLHWDDQQDWRHEPKRETGDDGCI